MEGRPQLGKYGPLFRHLVALDAPMCRVRFVDIEHILGSPLPKSARSRQWWANQADDSRRSQARAWQAAGWRTRRVDLKAETLVFERVGHSAVTAAGSCPPSPKRSQRPRYVAEPAPRSVETTPIPDAAQATTLGGEVFGHFGASHQRLGRTADRRSTCRKADMTWPSPRRSTAMALARSVASPCLGCQQHRACTQLPSLGTWSMLVSG